MAEPAKIPFFLVTGFLGSGKTSFLKQFIAKYSKRYRIAIVQNEFSSVNIDGKELQHIDKSIKLVEMNNGSVFCVCMISDFKQALHDLVTQNVYDAIVVEATGLADPIAVTQVFHDSFLAENLYLAHIWTIVDAENYSKIEKIKSAERQIRLADTIVLNKMDRFTRDVEALTLKVAQMNKTANLELAEYSNISLPDDLSFILAVPVKEKKLSGIPAKRPAVDTIVIKDEKSITQQQFEMFIKEIVGDIYRLKGFLNMDGNTFLVQKTFGHIEYNKLHYNNNTELIIIGTDLVNKQVQQLWVMFHSDIKTIKK